jgi:hypothetical protein
MGETYEIVYSGTPVKTVHSNSYINAAKSALYWYRKSKKEKRKSVEVLRRVHFIPYMYANQEGSYFYPVTKKDGDIRFFRLKGETLKDCIEEVRTRKLHRRDNSRGAIKRISEMRNSLEAADKLFESLEGFTWNGFARLRLKRSTLTNSLFIDDRNRFLLFNLGWVKSKTEQEIIVKLRSFVLNGVNSTDVLPKSQGNSRRTGKSGKKL